MSKRLEVLLDDAELAEAQRAADRDRVPLSEWVRAAIRERQRRAPEAGAPEKLAAVQRAAEHRFPVAGVDEMLAEIERGYLDDGR
jgi:hypothetical protein